MGFFGKGGERGRSRVGSEFEFVVNRLEKEYKGERKLNGVIVITGMLFFYLICYLRRLFKIDGSLW